MAGRSYLRPRADATSVHGRSLGYAASAMALPSQNRLFVRLARRVYAIPSILRRPSPKEFENGADGMALAAPGGGRGARGGIRHGREPGAVVRGYLVDWVRQRSRQLALHAVAPDRQVQRHRASGRLDLSVRRYRQQPDRRPRRCLRARPERIARRRGRAHRQGAVGSRKHERHDEPRLQLLGNEGRRRPADHLLDEQPAAGGGREDG